MPFILDFLFGSAAFQPHGYCLLWETDLVALHAVSDLLVALSYFSIPTVIFAFMHHRPDLQYREIGWLFVTFITACGATHLMGLVTLWYPAYGLQGIVKAFTAGVSLVTALLLWSLLPRVLRLPTPAALQAVNQRLQEEVEQRRFAEDKLQYAHDDLDRRVRERTRDLSRANDDLQQFNRIVSHDLKSPLRGMRALVGWLKKDVAIGHTDAVGENLSVLEKRINRMETLITDLHTYASTGLSEAQAEPVDLEEVVGTVITLINPPKAFAVEVEPMPVFEVQRAPFEIVFRNLLTNAIKHHDRGEGRIKVAGQDRGDYLEFIVQDDGPGIDMLYRDEVFKVFRRLVTRDDVEGTGVGLSIVKRLIDLHGGTIGIEAPPKGRGTLVRFTWPHSRSLAS